MWCTQRSRAPGCSWFCVTGTNSGEEDILEANINHETDRQLTPKVSSGVMGNREALSNVFGSHRQRLLHEALRVLGNNEDAEDALQEGLLSAFQNLHRFEGRARLSTWLTRIVINAARMRRRSLRAHEWQSIDEPIPWPDQARLSARLIDTNANPEETLLRSEQRRILKQGLRGLSWRHRRVLSLHDLQGMTPKEASLSLGLAVGTVKSQVHRGRRKLLEQVRRIQGHSSVSRSC
jgi:RNA polymerase sigma-70 factor, ECF subfamily